MQPLTTGPWRKERRRTWITENKQATRTRRATMSKQIQVTRRPRPAPAPAPDAPTVNPAIAKTWFTP
jgi:hypothetical protein